MSTKTDTNPTFQELEALKSMNRELRAIVAVLVRRMGGKASINEGIMLEIYGLALNISRSEDGSSIEISV